jgi:hypothetical protein
MIMASDVMVSRTGDRHAVLEAIDLREAMRMRGVGGLPDPAATRAGSAPRLGLRSYEVLLTERWQNRRN